MAEQGTATTQQPFTPAPGAQPGQGGDASGLLMMVVGMVLFFYFLVIRPHRTEQKKKEEMLGQLKVKSKVMTFLGLYGTVVEIEGDDVILLVDPKKDVKMRFRRSAIESILDSGSGEEKK